MSDRLARAFLLLLLTCGSQQPAVAHADESPAEALAKPASGPAEDHANPKHLEPIPFIPGADMNDVDGKSFDLVVIGGTPGGIACAVRAAREGLSVLLVNHTQHIGGFITSGAGGWEAPYDGLRSPLYAEIRTGAERHYLNTYGPDSQQHLASMPNPDTNRHIDRPKIEPRIAELLFDQMTTNARTLTVLKGCYVSEARRDGRRVRSVTLRQMDGDRTCRVTARVFADGMYEGDLAAAAGVAYSLGREARSQYDEPHAGVIYTLPRERRPGQTGFPQIADDGLLNIRSNNHATAEVVPGPQSGEADPTVMAYNYRLILTKDPANRVMVPRPADTNPDGFTGRLNRSIVPNLPNHKIAWNGGGRLIGPQRNYPEGDWRQRHRISRLYLEAALRELWMVQNAPSVSEAERSFWEGYGLAADEFPDNDHLPYEVYVREARRIIGRYVFTEHDGVVAEATARPPIHADSIAVTDWPMDSVACTARRVPGANSEGVFFLADESRPAQVPYRCMLPQDVDNLLVPVALSASHVGWGCIRLEPVWMQTGEAAGFAAALAVRHNTTPAELDPDLLIRTLVAHRSMVSFFNDTDVTSDDPRVSAAQYFGTQGFFSDFDARLDEPLMQNVAELWREGFNQLQRKVLIPQALAEQIHRAQSTASEPTGGTRGRALLDMWNTLNR